MTCFLRDTNSYFQLLRSLQNLVRYSGLRVNNEKQRFLLLVRTVLFKMFLLTKYVVWSKCWEVILIMIPQLDWRPNFNYSCSWKRRVLTLIGKIQIVKSLISRNFLAKQRWSQHLKTMLKKSTSWFITFFGKESISWKKTF